jgi:SAM-dependent methyltransferase
VNRHIDVAENHANNMRLFEATGCGALLITDYKDNLAELFDIGREVVAYRSPEECVELVAYYLQHPEQAATIARAGQARTLRDHSYAANLAETSAILRNHLRRLHSVAAPVPQAVSTGYRSLANGRVDPQLLTGWQSPDIPARQWALVGDGLASMYRGQPQIEFTVLQQALAPFVRRGQSLLEVGCSSGYYGEVLQYLLPRRLEYVGVDYSAAMIEMARAHYPAGRFVVADGAALPYDDASFDTVVSGCLLMHTPQWQAQIRDAVRVSRDLVVLHRTPVSHSTPTQQFSKLAYGVPTIELRFNESELLEVVLGHGTVLAAVLAYRTDAATDAHEVTYVFRKRR